MFALLSLMAFEGAEFCTGMRCATHSPRRSRASPRTFSTSSAGILIVETVFSYPGIGTYLVQAVSVRDITQVQAAALILAAIYIVINIAADVIVILLVPKLRTGLYERRA